MLIRYNSFISKQKPKVRTVLRKKENEHFIHKVKLKMSTCLDNLLKPLI